LIFIDFWYLGGYFDLDPWPHWMVCL